VDSESNLSSIDNDNLLPLSALQHLLFCPRQVALIHTERLWVDNILTVQGQLLHRKADQGPRRGGRRHNSSGSERPTEGGSLSRSSGVTVARAVPLRCLRLGLWGRADVVEFHSGSSADAVPFPVEYKRGRPKHHDADRIQLCAQALCLEEMLGRSVPAGAIYYGKIRRRVEVPFDANLRKLTEQAAAELHDLLASGLTPAPVYERKKCDRCSLKSLCLPEHLRSPARASTYVQRSLVLSPDAPTDPSAPR
jgi:CRISPR-associated exonuclease Cas4